MSQIYSKTDKGQEEIKTRAGGLSQRMRQVLIFVDGKRSRDDLHGMLKGDDLDELLASLAAQGLIEASGSAAPKPAAAPAPAPTPAAPAASAPAAAPKPAPVKAPEAPKPSPADLERRRREEEEQAELLMARSFMGRMS